MAKISLVTGAASGIGKATATALARAGHHVVIVVRNEKRAEETMRDIRASVPDASLEAIVCDLSSQASIRAAAAEFQRRHDRLHVLVNCAGVFVKEREVTADGLERTFATNYLAYFLLTNLLLDAVKRAATATDPARIVLVGSKTQGTKIDLDDLNLEKRKYSYLRATPPTMVARQMLAKELSERLKGTNVVVNNVHPGLVAGTALLKDVGGFFRWMTDRVGGTPEKGADTVVWAATAPEATNLNGMLLEKRRPIKMAPQALDPEARRRLWTESERLTKLA